MNFFLAAALCLLAAPKAFCADAPLPSDFVRLRDVDASILQDIRYAGPHNFVGRPIAGYAAPECLLVRAAARALAEAQAELKPYGLSLKVYDCYRPQRAVDDFVAWAKNTADQKMKKEFYPNVDKADLFKDGYIAAKSGHSRGATVDLTLVSLPAAPPERYSPGDALRACTLPRGRRYGDEGLDMGTGFDCFDPRAHTAAAVGRHQKMHRLLLKTLLEKHGFTNLPEEWWHFTLSREPYPDRTFDVEVR
ncbi:MAG: M15 family metallopeptidase [Elusimicrobia bacterium]|nr:M15 family metallopeptidase [Elusimicrobiota bacterium]